MLRSTQQKLILGAIIVMTTVLGCPLSQQSLPSDAGSTCENSLTPAEFDSWFESGSASLNGAVFPANSVLFPDEPNCSFYKWSEQMFLWLTSPAPARYGSSGLVMNTSAFYDVSLPGADGFRDFIPHTSGRIRAFNLRTAQRGILDLPIILERKTLRMLEIMPPVLSPAGKQLVMDKDGNEVEVGNIKLGRNEKPTLLDVTGKEILGPKAIMRSKSDQNIRTFERKIERLGNFDTRSLVQKIMIDSRFVLLDLFGNFPPTEQGQADGGVLMAQNGSLVYYSLMVNNVFALYRTMQGASVPAGTKFPLNQIQLDNISLFAQANGKSPMIDSQALAIEIKTSWVEAAGLVDADKFIQMKAEVPTYDKTNPNEWVPNGSHVITLAMVGLHVVGSTGSLNPANGNGGHPEMLWATFEHVSNCPNAEYRYRTSGGGNTTIPQNTAGNWVFCANGSAGPFNEMRMMMNGDHVVSNPPFTISASNILRTKPWGLNGNTPIGNAEVISINNTVRSLLDPADLRRNYVHGGTTWTIFGASPTGANQVGTNILANTTMETFTQGSNCFSCHATNTTIVSHVFNDTNPLF